jgi:hypothetical protein
MSVQVDPKTHEAVGEPELIVAGRMFDDFCIDEDREVLYVTTHRQNAIDRVPINPAANSGFTQSVAGDPHTEELIGHAAVSGGEAPANMAVWPISSRMVALVPTARWSRQPSQGFARAILLANGCRLVYGSVPSMASAGNPLDANTLPLTTIPGTPIWFSASSASRTAFRCVSTT